MKRYSFLRIILEASLLVALLTACGPGLEAPGSTSSSGSGASGSDPCLQGMWTMSNPEVYATLVALAPIPGLSVPSGMLTMVFDGSDFSYAPDGLVIRINNPSGYLEAEATFLFNGAFSTSGGNLAISETIYSVEALTWRAVINGETAEAPGPSALAFPLPGSGPYECTDSTLTIGTAGGANGPVDLIFRRQR